MPITNRRPWLIVAGLALLLAAVLVPLGGVAGAQDLPPRPTAIPAATATPAPDGDDDDSGEAAAPGRITGTVIDLTTGAPAPGVAVIVGDATVQSDANGNYDRNGLAPGDYGVALALEPGRGEPAQAGLTVSVAAGQTVVQHLAFRSPVAPAAPAAAPQAEAAPVPAALPATGAHAAGSPLLALAGLALIAGGAVARRRG